MHLLCYVECRSRTSFRPLRPPSDGSQSSAVHREPSAGRSLRMACTEMVLPTELTADCWHPQRSRVKKSPLDCNDRQGHRRAEGSVSTANVSEQGVMSPDDGLPTHRHSPSHARSENSGRSPRRFLPRQSGALQPPALLKRHKAPSLLAGHDPEYPAGAMTEAAVAAYGESHLLRSAVFR